eukprot:166331_1
MNPLSIIADKISDYQKYCIIYSHFIKRAIDENYIEAPALIDFTIICPAVYNRIVNNYTAQKTFYLGSIERHLKEYSNKSYSILAGSKEGGLNDDDNNFDKTEIKRIVDSLLKSVKKVTDTVGKKKYQRFVVIIDRRWRVLSKKHVMYNKIRSTHTSEMYEHEKINKDAFDEKEFRNDPGLTHETGQNECEPDLGTDDDDDDDSDDGLLSGSFG